MVDTLSQLPTDSTDKTLLEDETPVLIIESDDIMDETTSINVSVEPQKSTTAHSVFNTSKRNIIPRPLAEFIKAQFANQIFQNSGKQLGQAETKLSCNKRGVFVRRALIDGALQKLVPQLL